MDSCGASDPSLAKRDTLQGRVFAKATANPRNILNPQITPAISWAHQICAVRAGMANASHTLQLRRANRITVSLNYAAQATGQSEC